MTKYQQFLTACGVISEDEFNNLISCFPEEYDCITPTINVYRLDSADEICENIINEILSDWKDVHAECVDFKNKTMELWDVDSLEDFEKLKKTFSKWTITNEEEIIEDINEHERDKDFDSCISLIRTKASLEQLKNFSDSL
jgi:hypothetical protein